jgi:DNA-binding NtrC family response regulator
MIGRLRRIERTALSVVEADAAPAPLIRPARAGFESLASAESTMRVVQRQARLAASIDLPFLVVGEAGVGKRWLAGVIHDASARRPGPLVVLACGRLPLEQCRSLLSGRSAARMGWEGGTLFLQEPHLLPTDVQRELLERLSQETQAGVRLAAGMCMEPATAIERGLMLPDLAYQLQTLVIRIPPLRERAGDLDNLIEVFWKRTRTFAGKAELGLSNEAKTLLTRYAWPGNLHELGRVLQAAAQSAPGKTIAPEDLPAHLRLQLKLEEIAAAPPTKPPPLDSLLEQVERRMLGLALKRFGGNKSRAAEWLGVWRARLIRRLEALGLEKKDES